jgi:hypothetical protein
MKLAVPAYFGPWEHQHWEALLHANPATVVINPESGPGTVPHLSYRPVVSQLQQRGALVLGYVTTSWSNRSFAECAQDVASYFDHYNTGGVLFDEVPPDSTTLPLVRELATLCGPRTVVFNLGRAVPNDFRTEVPQAQWVTFEGTARQYLQRHGRGSGGLPAQSSDWHLVHSVPRSLLGRVGRALIRNRPGFCYSTADRMPNPWDVFDSSGPGNPDL